MMRPLSTSSTTDLPPDTICGYTVLKSPALQTYIALADGGRKVLLKPLDPDCLLHGQLHPSIKERLARVRELALKSTANLHGVERDHQVAGGGVDGKLIKNADVFLVWEFIDGEPLESQARSLSSPQLIALMREVALSVEALHQVGIVHGAIHARNIIAGLDGRPRLTHISPLLFHDPAVDETAVRTMILKLIDDRRDIDAFLRTALQQPISLRQIASRLVTVDNNPSESNALDADDRRRRSQMLLLALATAAAGLVIAAIAAAIGMRLRI